MSDGELHKNKELREKVIEYFNLDETDINERTKGGGITKVESKVTWTIQYLRRSVLIQTLGRGDYRITPRGMEVYESDIDNFDIDYLVRFQEFQDYKNKKTKRKKSQPKETPSPPEEPKPTEPKKEEGFVYYIQEEMDGNIKIGFSDDPIKRLSQHQTSNPRELRMLVYVKGNKEDEKKIQKKFESLQTTGEWFKPDKRLLVHIEKEKSKFFEIVQNLSTDYEELKKRLEVIEGRIR